MTDRKDTKFNPAINMRYGIQPKYGFSGKPTNTPIYATDMTEDIQPSVIAMYMVSMPNQSTKPDEPWTIQYDEPETQDGTTIAFYPPEPDPNIKIARLEMLVECVQELLASKTDHEVILRFLKAGLSKVDKP